MGCAPGFYFFLSEIVNVSKPACWGPDYFGDHRNSMGMSYEYLHEEIDVSGARKNYFGMVLSFQEMLTRASGGYGCVSVRTKTWSDGC